MAKLTHLNDSGEAHMVDVGEKPRTQRQATAQSIVKMKSETLRLIMDGGHKKGDVFAVARIAGIQAAKKCSDLIPLCHPLMLSSVNVEIEADVRNSRVIILASCGLVGQTGVEMESLTAASITALTIYDMCKAIDKSMEIVQVKLLEKIGGRSGHWQADK